MEAEEFVQVIAPWLDDETRAMRSHLSLAVRQAIGNGLLTVGDRLPPEREMAAALHVSRPTVSAMVDDLRRGGLVRSRQGSGTWVCEGSANPVPTVPFAELVHAHGLIDLAAATAPDAGLLPQVRFDSADLLAADPANGLNPIGVAALRQDVAARARRWQPEVDLDNVIITSGAHQALALLVATLATRGSVVLVEDTTYGGLIDIIRANGAKPIGIARDDDGPVTDALRLLVTRHEPSMIILVASVHSPSGTVTSAERAIELAEALDGLDCAVVIDETYADLEFLPSGRRLSSSLGPTAIRVGSLSKSGWLGLRTGWLIAPPDVCTAVTRQRWSQFDLGPSVPSQLVARGVLAELDSLLVTRLAQLRERYDWLREAIARHLPDWELTPTKGGLASWVRLPTDDTRAFVADAAARGVAVLPGSACRADNGPDPHLRICFDRPIDVLEAAFDRLVDL